MSARAPASAHAVPAASRSPRPQAVRTRNPRNSQVLRHYASVIELWRRRFDTAEIAAELELDEGLVVKWVANFRDLVAAS